MSSPSGRGRGSKPHHPRGRGRSTLSTGIRDWNNPFSIFGTAQTDGPNFIDLDDYLNQKKAQLEAFLAQQKHLDSKSNVTGSDSKPVIDSKSDAASSGSKPVTLAQVVQQEPIYITGPYTEEILPLEEEDNTWITDPYYIKQKYMDQTSYPVQEYKYRYLYEEILKITGSVEIRHFYPNNRLGPQINYSQCFISKVYTLIDWGNDPMKSRTLRLPNDPQKDYSFNFWDYINAWKYTFLYENNKRKHSWFIRIREEFFDNTKIIPRWFLKFWQFIGPPMDLLPSPLQELYDSWIEVNPLLSDVNKKSYAGQAQFYFWAQFHIPWIWKWGLRIEEDDLGIPHLIRTFHFQWWKQIDVPELIAKINKATSGFKQKQAALSPEPFDSKSNYIAQLKLSIKRRHPNISNRALLAKCLEYMQNEFAPEFEADRLSQHREQMSLDSHSTHSDDAVLTGESQNPGDDPSSDEVISAAVEILRQDKGKGPATD